MTPQSDTWNSSYEFIYFSVYSSGNRLCLYKQPITLSPEIESTWFSHFGYTKTGNWLHLPKYPVLWNLDSVTGYTKTSNWLHLWKSDFFEKYSGVTDYAKTRNQLPLNQ